jgi:hypothetical protein
MVSTVRPYRTVPYGIVPYRCIITYGMVLYRLYGTVPYHTTIPVRYRTGCLPLLCTYSTVCTVRLYSVPVRYGTVPSVPHGIVRAIRVELRPQQRGFKDANI